MKTSVSKTTDSGSQQADLGATDVGATDLGAADLEELLEAAGIDFTVVGRCPQPGCAVCGEKDLSAAA